MSRQSEPGRRAAIADAIRDGFEKLYAALDEPREGTILTVARGVADAAERAALDTPDLGDFVKRMLEDGEETLADTPRLLASLRDAGVVDAGGMGFMRMFEGMVRYVEGDPLLAAADRESH